MGTTAIITNFVGRRQELAEIRRWMENSRLVTLTGPGGIGKTRLALEAAAHVRRAFPDGVWPVDLASLEDGREVASTVTLALAVTDQSNKTALERLVGYVQKRRLLLVLDNCEHILEDTAAFVGELLEEAPQIHVLATSRESLGIDGEQICVIPPLSVPSADQLHDTATIDHSDAVRLLVDRARNIVPGFEVTSMNRAAVRQLCEWLDGMPLAIELAATRLRTLSVGQIVEHLDRRFQFLTRGSRVARPRHQTLRALIDWSYELCTPDEQLLWARLSVFPGGFDLDAVKSVCGFEGMTRSSIVDLLDRLVAKSITFVHRAGERVRYGQLMTIREYGAERLDESGEHSELKRRHRDHYLIAAESMVANWCGPGQHEELAGMRRDHANLLSALEWSVNTPGEQKAGATLAALLRYHWIAGGFLSDGRNWLERILAELGEEVSPERGSTLWVCAWVALIQGDRDSAAERLRAAEAVAAELEDTRISAHAAHWWALHHLFSGDLAFAIEKYREAIAVHTEVGDTASMLTAMFQLGMAQTYGDRPREALDTCRQVIDISARHGERWNRAYSEWVIGLTWWRLGDLSAAKRAGTAALEIQQDFTDAICTALTVELMSWIALSNSHLEASAALAGAVQSVWTGLGTTVDAFGPHIAADSRRMGDRLRDELGSVRVKEFAAGLAHATKAEAIKLALGGDLTTVPAPMSKCPLTRRELDVARLVAKGLSNREIAVALVIALRTVDGHVERILGKLGFSSRTRVASWVASMEGGAAISEPNVPPCPRGT